MIFINLLMKVASETLAGNVGGKKKGDDTEWADKTGNFRHAAKTCTH